MKTIQILVIDDAATFRHVIRIGLTSAFSHIEIIEAANGRHAQTLLNGSSVDLVLCDWEMPEINGHKLLVWMKANESLKKTPFIMITGNADKQNVIAALQAGLDGYVVKPFNMSVLVKKVSEVMAKRGIIMDLSPDA